MKALLNALKTRHSILLARISDEERKPRPDGLRLRNLRMLRLSLSGQIAALERQERLQPAH
ncbi:hypothetical protein [Rhizobium paknamense]|uniref:DUF465 domain-containing protein n=1 Tax=Rhizobium paknamense TaxID=1206817 RepID=A0ABU0ILT1_9HYPH|nr:hypothetical protein [Rhizobium paknamense]MDQ0458154.1 hypothetical protein [Rhizobium paknamense]